MRTRFSRLSLLAAPAFFFASAAAAAAPPLLWKDAAAEALKANPSLLSARLAVEAADSGLTVASAGFWPSLSANAGFSRSGYAAVGTATALSPESETDGSNYQLGLQGNWNLFSGFATVYGRLGASEALAEKKALYSQASAALLSSLRQAFNQLYFDQKNAALLQNIADRYHKDTRYQDLQFQSGQTARWTFLKAQSDEAEVKWQVEQNQLNLQADQSSLASLLGRPQDQAPELGVDGGLDVPAPPESDAADWAKISKDSPTVLLAQATLASNEDALGSARAGLYPDLNAAGSYGYSGANSWGPDSKAWSASLSLGFNLFAGGANAAAINQASDSLDASRQDLSNTLSMLEASLHKAWASYTSSYQRLPVVQQATAAGEERFKTVEVLYQSGRAAFLDYEQAESISTQAQQQELSADLSAAQARAEYLNVLGLSLEEAQYLSGTQIP